MIDGKLYEIILIARCIIEENPNNTRLHEQGCRMEQLAQQLDPNYYCQSGQQFNNCSIFKKSPQGCTTCPAYKLAK